MSETPAYKYRLLTREDKIQRGDEHLTDDCETWEPVKGWVIGCEYNPAFFLPIRRAI